MANIIRNLMQKNFKLNVDTDDSTHSNTLTTPKNRAETLLPLIGPASRHRLQDRTMNGTNKEMFTCQYQADSSPELLSSVTPLATRSE